MEWADILYASFAHHIAASEKPSLLTNTTVCHERCIAAADTVITISSASPSSDMCYQCMLCRTSMKCKRSMSLVYFLLSRLLCAVCSLCYCPRTQLVSFDELGAQLELCLFYFLSTCVCLCLLYH